MLIRILISDWELGEPSGHVGALSGCGSTELVVTCVLCCWQVVGVAGTLTVNLGARAGTRSSGANWIEAGLS